MYENVDVCGGLVGGGLRVESSSGRCPSSRSRLVGRTVAGYVHGHSTDLHAGVAPGVSLPE